MSEQVRTYVGGVGSRPPSLPHSLSVMFLPNVSVCVCLCARARVRLCVQLIVAREQATQAELKLYDIALEMHEKMSKQRDQLTSHFEVLHTSTLVNLMCYHDYYTTYFSSSVCVLATPRGWRS